MFDKKSAMDFRYPLFSSEILQTLIKSSEIEFHIRILNFASILVLILLGRIKHLSYENVVYQYQ